MNAETLPPACGSSTTDPFDGQSTFVRENPKRFHFVTREEAQAVLEACPNVQWRLVFALCRYAGLRCASEIAALKWADVNWETMRFTVHASKTEHHGDGGVRLVPIFPELVQHLQDAFDAAEPGAVYCCPQYENANQMYRKVILQAVERAGLTPWPKLFQNCRSSRETELAEEYPVHVVCEWIGNSPRVAAKHYLQVTQDHYAKAVQEAVQNPVQQVSARGRAKSHEERAEVRTARVCGPAQENAAPCEGTEPRPLGVTGLEPVASSL
jgi:integrase